MSEAKITLPVTGMTCANCVASVERNTKKVAGVSDAVVNFASERVTVTYDPAVARPHEMIARIQRAGYDVPTAVVELPLVGMTCANCANTIQRRLGKVEGVLEANVNFATEKAQVTYVPGTVTRAELVAAVRKAGYDVVETAGDESMEDAEAAAREAEIQHQTRRFVIGLLFTLPLFLMSMGRDLGLLGHWAHDA